MYIFLSTWEYISSENCSMEYDMAKEKTYRCRVSIAYWNKVTFL
jgi:hypothetical protein